MHKRVVQRYHGPLALDWLFGQDHPVPALSSCDHYASSATTIHKSLALQRARGPEFDVTLDLEDGSAHGQEAAQRALIHDALNSELNCHDCVGVRIHGVDTTAWQADVNALITRTGRLPAYLTLPKARDPRDVRELHAYLNQRLIDVGHSAAIPIHVLIEDVAALPHLDAIARAPGVECLSFGLLDFVASCGGAVPDEAIRSPGQFDHPLIQHAKLRLAIACHAARIVPAHSITLQLDDPTIVRADALHAAQRFGYTRMWSIHPNQIDAILSAFAIGESQLETAVDVLARAEAVNWRPLRVDGELQDLATYRIHWARLRRVALLGRRVPSQALRWIVPARLDAQS